MLNVPTYFSPSKMSGDLFEIEAIFRGCGTCDLQASLLPSVPPSEPFPVPALSPPWVPLLCAAPSLVYLDVPELKWLCCSHSL